MVLLDALEAEAVAPFMDAEIRVVTCRESAGLGYNRIEMLRAIQSAY